MKIRRKRVVIFISVSAVFLTLILIIGWMVIYNKCSIHDNPRSLLAANLENAISKYQAGEISIIDISALTDFEWDRLFVFEHYSTPKYINNTLGTFWLCSEFTMTPHQQNMSLFVFMNDGHVVQYFEISRITKVDATTNKNLGYSIEESNFIVDERGRIIWIGQK